MSENNLASGETKTTETVSGSTTTTTTVYSSSSEVNPSADQEKLSLVEKARLGFVSDQEAHGLDIEPEHSATPVKTTLTLDQVGNSAGALLRYHRESLGYSLQEIAKYLKVRGSTVADLESDQLAQETAVNFTTGLLRRYSKLLNLDPNTVISLYMQKVASMVKINQEVQTKQSDSHMRRNVLIIVLILIVAGVGAGVALWGEGKIGNSSSSSSSSNRVAVSQSGELGHDGQESYTAPAVSANAQGQFSADASGELQAGMELPMEIVSKDLNLNNSEPVKPLSENTVKAQAQAEALSTQDEDKIETAEEKPTSLPLNNETIERQKAAEAEAAKLAQEQQQAQAQKEQDQSNAAAASAEDSKNAAQTANNANQQGTEPAAAAEEAKAEEKATETANAPTLNKSLKNISSQVKIVDRDNSIPSLNQVEITVLKDVALEVKSNSKTLKSGVFKAGEKIKLTSIPPFVVSVSDTTAVRINYLEGVLQTPKATQVTFELPTK